MDLSLLKLQGNAVIAVMSFKRRPSLPSEVLNN